MFDHNAPRTRRGNGTPPMALAVVGFSGRFPGGANSPEALWEVLRTGRDAVGEVDGSRWDKGWHNADPDRDERIYAMSGGFLDQIDGFDADFFGISSREAQQIDPQQRLLLELTWEAFEDAGIPARGAAGRNVGVYVGISNGDYGHLPAAGMPDAYSNTGSAFSIAANRISYVFDLAGPSMAVDTACSSSLVCIHQACEAIRSGTCDAALAGGVNLLADVRPWLGFSRASMLSQDGRCKSFDESGNGYVRAEGGGLVLIKPLADAQADGDHIHCVIRATGVNSDGRTLGLSMPNGDAQADLLRQVYAEAEIEPGDVFYVEAHGTGTSVGDPIECEALGKVIGSARPDGSRCHIGSVKSNIGHLESASGIAGMAKVMLAMKHRTVPANLHFETPNPKIDFDGWKLGVVDAPLPFPDRETPVLIGINSFGFGGTNAHVVLEEYRPAQRSTSPDKVDATPAPDLLLISASSPEALSALAQSYADVLEEPDTDFATVAAGAATCRAPLQLRLVIRATTAAEAAQKLRLWLAETPAAGTATGSASSASVPTAFVFSGNGPQWWGMGRELLAANAIFREEIAAVDAVFAPLAGWSILDEMARPEAEERIGLTEIAQPMLFAMQLGLVAAMKCEGIVPDAVFGHSVGEVAAASASGALSREQATQVIYHRSKAQAATSGSGQMAALGLDVASAEEAVAQIGGWLEIAAVNGPEAVTVAGDALALQRLVDKVTADGRFARMLKLDYPFHTKAMDPLRAELMETLSEITPGATQVPFISTVTGAQMEGADLTAAYWFDNVRARVEFSGAVAHALEEFGVALFVEIGPHPVLKDYVSQVARHGGQSVTALQTLRRPSSKGPESDTDNFETAVAAAYANGARAPGSLFERPTPPPSLPGYPWQRSRHWRGAVGLPDAFVPIAKDHPLLGARLPRTDGFWENTVDPAQLPYLQDHVVQGSVLFPAAGHLELLVSAARMKWGADRVVDVETLQIERPLVLPTDGDPLVQTLLDSRDGTAEISSRRGSSVDEQTVHVRARLSVAEDQAPTQVDLDALRGRLPVEIAAEDHYADCRFRGLDYGPKFRGIRKIWLTDPAAKEREALAEVEVEGLSEFEAYRSHPAIFDSCLQATITLVAQNDKRPVSTIPVQFERVRSFAPLTRRVVCRVAIVRESERSVVADITMMSPDGQVLLQVEGGRCQKANLTGAIKSPLLSEAWRLDPAHPSRGALAALPASEQIVAALPVADDGPADVTTALDRIAALYACKALDGLRPASDRFDLPTIARAARIRRDGTARLTQLLEIAASAGQVTREGRDWVWAPTPVEDPETLWAETLRAHPGYQAELLALCEIGETLVERLTGKDVPPLDAALAAQLRDVAPTARAANALCADVVEALCAQWPEQRPVRVLEIGGGAGGLTAWVLPLLPAQKTDYLFTDPSEERVARAERRLADQEALRCSVVSPLLEMRDQGLAEGYFDLVIVSDTSALGKAPADALERIAPVMADGAVLLGVAPRAGAAASLIFGEQQALETSALEAAGFAAPVVTTRDGAEICLAALAAARSGSPVMAAEVQSFLVVGDPVDPQVAAAVQGLKDVGHSVLVEPVPATEEDASPTFARILTDGAIQHVVLVGDPIAPASPATLLEEQSRHCMAAVALVRAMEEVRDDAPSDLTIVTRGAFPTALGAPALNTGEAALWGMGRVIANEHRGVDLRLVDLQASAEEADAGGWLAQELVRRDEETEVQIAHGHRFVARMRLNAAAKTGGATDSAFKLDFVPQGGIDSLHLAEAPSRAPAAGEVEIAVEAAGLNFRDVLWCMGMLPEEAVEHGFSGPTIGMECSGVVQRVGEDVTHLNAGDRVIAFAASCFGSHVVTEAKSVQPLPEGMTFEAAATIPTTFLTAWYGLDYLARLEEDETVLIHGAAGGVGLAAIQIAQAKGARIIGTAGSPRKRAMLRMLGVDHVLDSRTLEFADQAMAITGGKGVDVVLNSLAGEAITKGLGCLRPFGRFLEIGKRDLYANSRIGLRPFRNNLSYFGIDADTLLIERPKLAARLFGEVISMFGDETLTPLPHQVVPVTRAGEAFRAMQQSRHVGKLVVSMETGTVAPRPLAQQGIVRSGGTYLVTGGLAGFGLATARWLAEQGASALALVSRSGAQSESAKAALADFAAMGVEARAFATDIADHEALSATLETIRSVMPPLKGVIHAAAVIEDAPVAAITPKLLHTVLRPKMIGAANLHELTLKDDLETFVLYSSSSAVVGNAGQGAYVAANLYLDALAMQRRAMGLPALSVGWGAISDAGFLTRHENVADMLKTRTGLDATPAAEALSDLNRALASGVPRQSVARFDMMRLAQLLPAAQSPRFAPVIPKDGAVQASEETLAEMLEGMPKAERYGFVRQRVLENTARVLGTTAAQVNADKALSDLGLDSLMAVELAGAIERDIGQTVPVMQLLGVPSLGAVADFAAQKLGVEIDQGGARPAEEPAAPATAAE